MKKYNLSYIKDKIITPIDLSKFCGKKYSQDLQTIDEFTANFQSQDELIDFLIVHNLIPNEVGIDHIYLTYTVSANGKSWESIVYDGDILMFNNSATHLNSSFVKYKFDEYMHRPGDEYEEYLKSLGALYSKKYASNPKLSSFGSYLARYREPMQSIYTREENKKMILLYIKKIFENSDEVYENIRDFVLKVDYYVEGDYDIDRVHSYDQYNHTTAWANNAKLKRNPRKRKVVKTEKATIKPDTKVVGEQLTMDLSSSEEKKRPTFEYDLEDGFPPQEDSNGYLTLEEMRTYDPEITLKGAKILYLKQ